MFRIAIVAAGILVASFMAAQFIDNASRHPAAPAQPAPAAAAKSAPLAAVAVAPASTGSRRMVIRAGTGGHFAVDGMVNGRLISFLIDTGASQIALRASDAARLGFHPMPRDYSIRLATANGEGRAALVQLGIVEIGNILLRDIPALITPDEALGVNLLGMSFLSRVRWSHEHGNLIIEQ